MPVRATSRGTSAGASRVRKSDNDCRFVEALETIHEDLVTPPCQGLAAVKKKAQATECDLCLEASDQTPVGLLLDEQHLAVRRQRPGLVRRQHFDLIADLAQLRHSGDDLVAHVLRVFLR